MYPDIVLFCEMAVGCFQTEDRSLYVRDRQDIYWVRRFGKMIKEGRRMMKTSEELHPYIFVCASIQTLDEGCRSPLDALESPRLQHDLAS